jgi:hypothetical protein
MDPTLESRLVNPPHYPKIVYLESLLLFFGANFIYHQRVFRHNQNKVQFAGFLLANLFTSFQLCDATNRAALAHYAAQANNTFEIQHRALINQKLRTKLFNQQ